MLDHRPNTVHILTDCTVDSQEQGYYLMSVRGLSNFFFFLNWETSAASVVFSLIEHLRSTHSQNLQITNAASKPTEDSIHTVGQLV